MPVRLVVLPRGSTHDVVPSARGFVDAWTVPDDPRWIDVTTSIVEASVQHHAAMDVFVCLLGDGITTHGGRLEAKSLLDQARNAGWSAPFLVVSTQMGRANQMRRDCESLCEWLTDLSGAGMQDILRVSYDSRRDASIRPDELRRACDETAGRRRELRAMT